MACDKVVVVVMAIKVVMTAIKTQPRALMLLGLPQKTVASCGVYRQRKDRHRSPDAYIPR